jgi:hypothetical protein
MVKQPHENELKHQFLTQYVLNRASIGRGEFSGVLAAEYAIESWEVIKDSLEFDEEGYLKE